MQKEMQNKITRLLYELNALDKGPVNLNSLAKELGVSLRTVQRDIRTIQEAEFPLYSPEAGTYAFIEGFSLGRIELSDKEASMLVFMSEIARSLGQKFDTSFSLLKKRLLGVAEESPFFVKFASGEEYPDTPISKKLAEFIRLREKSSVCYRGGKRACYPVRPLKIAWIEGFWYLLALTDDDKLLKFRLEKITSVKGLNSYFKHTAEIEKLLRECTNIWFEKQRDLSVRLEISAESAKYFKIRRYFPLQKIEKELANGKLEISCHAVRKEEIIPTILQWMPNIKVLEPKTLNEQIKRIVQGYTKEI